MRFLTLIAIGAILFFETSCNDVNPVGYLEKYGYISNEQYGNHDVTAALKDLQKIGGLKVTGKLDPETMELMAKPRCGMPDKDKNTFGIHFSGGVGGKWRKLHLTYAIESYTTDLPQSLTRSIIAKALGYWSDVSKLTFKEISGLGADVRINFGRYSHIHHAGSSYRCPYPFDGPSGVLAHAYYPSNGRVHFDDDENFTNQQGGGIDLLWVAAHEFGHTLGLKHSNDRRDLMYPWYKFDPTFNKLPHGDVRRIQSLYGARVNRQTTAGPTMHVKTDSPNPTTDRKTDSPRPTGGPKTCSIGWKRERNSCYLVTHKYMNFPQANTYCKSRNAHLLSILDMTENRFINGFSKYGYTWLGYNDIKKEGDWVWTDGSKSTFNRFKRYEGRPNRRENCAIIDYDGYWQDWPCTTRHKTICKLV